MALGYINYFNMKQILMDIRNSVSSTDQGQLISYVIGGFCVFIITLNLLTVTLLCKYSKDGYDALFASSAVKLLLKGCGVVQMSFVKIVMLPLLMLLISIPICTNDRSLVIPPQPEDPNAANLMFSYYYGGYQCWTIPHIVLTIFCLSFATAQAALSAIQSVLYNDIRFHCVLPWGNASTRADLIKSMIKILIAIALNIEFYNKWVLLVCQCGNIVLTYLLLHARWKFFYMSDKKVMVFTILLEGAYLWLSILVTLINAAELYTISYSLFAYIIISAIAFACLALVTFLNSKDSHYMLFSLPHLKHDYEFEQFFLKLQRHVTDSKVGNIDKILIYGLLKDHQRNANSRCTDPKCHCEQLFYLMSKNKLEAHLKQMHEMAEERQRLVHREDPKYSFKKVDQTKEYLNAKQHKRYEYKFRRLFFKFFYSILTKRIETQFPKSMRLKFLQVQVLQHELSNEFKSYFQVLKLLRDKPAIEFQYFLYQAKQSVEHIMYRKYQSLLTNKATLDVIKVYDFEEQFTKFEKQIVQTATNCLNFWKELMDKRLDVNRIHDFGVQISNSYQDVNEVAKYMMSLFPNHVVFQRIYASFLGDVMNNENEAIEILARVKAYLESANNMHKLNYLNEDKFFGYNTGTAIITITVTPRDIGNITNASYECMKLLGYRHKEIKGKNVRTLMPKILQDNHDSFLQNYFETAKAKILEQNRLIVAKDKDGYLVICNILVKAIPNLKRNLTFVGFLRKMDESDPFLQPPSQYSRMDYHIMLTDTEGQIYGFTRNCWETFGFKPAFFFNQFGDPEQQIRMEFIVKSLKDNQFFQKPELKKEGVFCSLDTGVVMENAPRELLSKEEQELMLSISGSYNINLQLEEISFWNNRINLRLFKIIKHSRIIRSQNAFDSVGGRAAGQALSFESQDIDSNFGEAETRQTKTNQGKKKAGLMFDDMDTGDKKDDDDGSVSHKEDSVFESSDVGSSNGAHGQSQQLINFKKQISTREMPQSIIKLNRMTQALVLVILAVVIFDTAQNYQFYNFQRDCQHVQQKIFNKHYIIAKISSSIITLSLMNQGLQDRSFDNYTSRDQTIRTKLLDDILVLGDIENTIQTCPDITANGIYRIPETGPHHFDTNPEMSVTILNQDSSTITDNAQNMRYAVTQLISKVGSMLQANNSETTVYLAPELTTLQTNYFRAVNTSYRVPKNRNISEVNTFYIVYNSLLDLTSVTANQLTQFYHAAFTQSEDLNHWLLVSAFIFFCVFVLLSGFVIFPIVVGVQRNKVMILSIYFDLPIIEIKGVHKRCFDFLCKIDDDRRNEAALNGIIDEQFKAEESKFDGEEEDVSRDVQDDTEFTKRGDQSSFMSNRELVENDGIKFKGTKKQKDSVNKKKSRRNKKTEGDRKQAYLVNGDGEKPANTQQRKDSEHSKDGDEDKEEDAPMDHNKMLKDIKISNNKLNIVTLSVIFVFLTYFSVCFGISLQYLNQIKTQIEMNTKLYAMAPTLQYSYLYFLTDLLTDNGNKTIEETYRYQNKIAQVFELLGERQEAKQIGVGIDWLLQVDNATFCQTVSPSLEFKWEQDQCPYFFEQIFRNGYMDTIFLFMYHFQQNRVIYDQIRYKQSLENLTSKMGFFNDHAYNQFSVAYSSYYDAEFSGMVDYLNSVIDQNFNKMVLFVQLRIIFFVLFTFTIFAFLWRIFLRNIQAEVFRSKGMLNMIPTSFLEKDNNMKKLSLNKLVNLG